MGLSELLERIDCLPTMNDRCQTGTDKDYKNYCYRMSQMKILVNCLTCQREQSLVTHEQRRAQKSRL